MNWKLVLLLSLCGIGIGFANVYFLPARYSALLETPVYLACAYVLARAQQRRHFIHGLIVGIISGAWATVIRITFINQYLAYQVTDAAQYTKMAAESHGTITQVIVLMGVFFTIVSGIVVGLFALAAGKIVKNLSGR